MDYYRCSKMVLHEELRRRRYRAYGDQDKVAELLKYDDERRGSLATTVCLLFTAVDPVKYTWKPNPMFGPLTPATKLLGQRIVHWTMNTFFPCLHLFFENGLSVQIDGSQLPDAVLGLDPELRSRLTDVTHEEEGSLMNTIIPQKLKVPSIRILVATVACRRSIAVKETHQILSARPVTTIVGEDHAVVGLQLEGMKSIAYIWARLPSTVVPVAGRMWGNVRIGGIRDDIPIPFVGFPEANVKPGQKSAVVLKDSMVAPKLRLNACLQQP